MDKKYRWPHWHYGKLGWVLCYETHRAGKRWLV